MEAYLKPLIEYINNGNEFDCYGPDFICLQYDIVDKLEADHIGKECFLPILKLMEENETVDFGTPGPLTHYIEKFWEEIEDYDKCVVDSVKRKPAIHTIILLNRIINSVTGKEKQDYIQILEEIQKNENIDNSIRDMANMYLEYHNQ